MARYVSTKTAAGGSGGGGAAAGLSAADVCNQICKLSTDATGTPGSVTATDLADQTTEISGGFSEWKMICNCPCWTDCYGCNIIWEFDTTKYRGFKLVYTGIKVCACCYMYFCPGIGSDNCFCNCNQAYMGRCMCKWPVKACCCWYPYVCCHMTYESCVYCCNSSYTDMWGFEWCVWAQCDAWGCSHQGHGVMFDWRYQRFIRNNSFDYDWQARDRQMGHLYCHCMVWSPCQNSSSGRYFQRLCLKVSDTPFMSTLTSSGGGSPTFQSSNGGACAAGQPCWTIWGIPCHWPEFGTCCMS